VNNSNNNRKRQRQVQHAARKIRVMQGLPIRNRETGQYTLLARSAGLARQSKTLLLELSEPTPYEECIIAMEAIKDYRLPFMPIGFREGIVEVEPELTKACLPCGHGFNALALLYHFAKNSMTCPFCRAGHEKHQLSLHSVPKHLRWHFTRHLEATHAEEAREQIAADAATAASMLEQEVSRGAGTSFMPMTRVVLLLFAYGSADSSNNNQGGTGREEPMLVLELPLTSSVNQATLAFASFGYSLAQLNLNLLRLPTRPQSFELAIGMQSMLHGNLMLFRTTRFPAVGPEHRIAFARDMPPEGSLSTAIQVSTMPGVHGMNVFYRMAWTVSVGAFASMVINAARESGGENEVAAV
jgi:hypothetical protein